jgi:uncharacterized membrane protein YgcG
MPKKSGSSDILIVMIVFLALFIFLLIFIRRATKNLRPNGTIMSRRGYRRWDDDHHQTPMPGPWWIGTGPTFGGGGGWGSSGGGDSDGGGFDFGGGDGGGGGAEGGW